MSIKNGYKRKKGQPPGTLVHVGEQNTAIVSLSSIIYNEKDFMEEENISLDKMNLESDEFVKWYDIIGVHNAKIIEDINNRIRLHPLILEDIMNTNQRTKMETYGECLFTVLKMLRYEKGDEEIDIEQVSFVNGYNYLISFQEEEGDVFEYVRNRIRHGKGKIRKMNSDYLLYSLIDAIVDNYFVIMESIDEEINSLEERMITGINKDDLEEIHRIKTQILILHRSVLPLRSEINSLLKNEVKELPDDILFYFRDIYDHLIRIIEQIDSHRETMNNLLDVYLSLNSNKMNEVMKILTVIATIFMPLTFIAGIYGMNFKYMPELEWQWSYPVVMIVMVVLVVIMLIFFKRKNMI
ncbi:MAG: magnesium/cobalt transporter CorA [bacterium]